MLLTTQDARLPVDPPHGRPMNHAMSRFSEKAPRSSAAHARGRRTSSGVRPQAEAKVTLDADDLEALTRLARATTSAEAQKEAARVRALLGGETPQVIELLDALVDRARHVQKVERLAGTDELTGAANRRAFNETLRRELSRARRVKSTLSLLLFDVDGLKRINDSLGHAGGDAALKTVAGCLRQGIREGDFAARLGGDEFAVILPTTGPEDARVIGERIRAMVERTGPSGMRIGVSLGSAVSQGGEPDASALLAAADLGLYRDKDARRAARAARAASPVRSTY